ncbi:hypothetical protein [Fodinicola acaciae]|uniref:hypothetical protein n=1 Tax=Fodinicola acaciae TaxID=2681555 RepID=UPI0013D5D4B8|nr:hypothetical protein [Fodinicola acaciae]
MYRKVMAVALVLGLGLGASACGGGSKPPTTAKANATSAAPLSPLDQIKAALTRSKQGNSCKLEVSLKMSMSDNVAFTLTGTGVTQFRPPATDLKMTGTVRAQGQRVPLKIHDITIGSTTYEKQNNEAWKKSNEPGLAGLANIAAEGNKDSAVAFLQYSKDAKSLGRTTIHGQPATGYDIALDPNSPDAKDLKDVKIKVWLDDSARIVQMKMAGPMKIDDGTANADMTVAMYDYGTPVHVVAPKHV